MKPPRVAALTRSQIDKAVKAMFARVPSDQEREQSDVFERLRANPPKQERSRATLQRLLDAAESVLEEEGLDATTVPAIAKRAHVSVGVVYRRFPNKDALIRGVYERFLWRIREQNSTMLTTLSRIQVKVPALLRGMIRGSIEVHRRKRRLLAALNQFAQTHPDPAMKRERAEMNRVSTEALTALMLSNRDRIHHPDPESAIRFAVLTLAAVIRATIVDDDPIAGLTAPQNLEDELTRLLFAYLGIDEKD